MRITIETNDATVAGKLMSVCMEAKQPVWFLGEPAQPTEKAAVVEPNGSTPNGSRHKMRHKCEECGKGFLGQKNARFCGKRCNANWYYKKVVKPGIALQQKKEE
jgi:hypothetical protein